MTDEASMPPIMLAFVIDGEVVEMLRTNDRLAAIFLSEPTILDITDSWRDANSTPVIEPGYKYDLITKTFTKPGEYSNAWGKQTGAI